MQKFVITGFVLTLCLALQGCGNGNGETTGTDGEGIGPDIVNSAKDVDNVANGDQNQPVEQPEDIGAEIMIDSDITEGGMDYSVPPEQTPKAGELAWRYSESFRMNVCMRYIVGKDNNGNEVAYWSPTLNDALCRRKSVEVAPTSSSIEALVLPEDGTITWQPGMRFKTCRNGYVRQYRASGEIYDSKTSTCVVENNNQF